MVDVSEPEIKGLVQIGQGASTEAGEEITPDGFKPALDFAFSLGFIGPGMDQGDAQGGGDLLQVMGAKGAAVIDVEFAGQPASGQGLLQGLEKKARDSPR